MLAAKFVGRWPSGAPLALAPDKDDPELGADPARNNAFLYGDDPRGRKCPLGAHARRIYARDAMITGLARMHRIIRRSSSYGPSLPEGVLEDDGADRGIMFFCLGEHWPASSSSSSRNGSTRARSSARPQRWTRWRGRTARRKFTVPQQPIRRRLTELPQFVVNRGGEYLFMPGLRALGWIADLDT